LDNFICRGPILTLHILSRTKIALHSKIKVKNFNNQPIKIDLA